MKWPSSHESHTKWRYFVYQELVLLLVWLHTGDKLLPKPLMAQFTDAYIDHQTTIS